MFHISAGFEAGEDVVGDEVGDVVVDELLLGGGEVEVFLIGNFVIIRAFKDY